MNSHHYALILAGGGGTRLWPKSREKTPKQFLHLTGDKTLLRETVERVRKLVEWDHMFVITNITQLAQVRKEVPEIPESQIICEPQKRETAMAMAVGAAMIQQQDPDAVVMNFASDHVVTNTEEFVRVMNLAATTAEDSKHLVTVGIPPTFPHTGLGYICIDGELDSTHSLPVFRVQNFTEKPNLATAQAFLATGKYFWNANMYTWSVRAIETAFKKHAPATAQVLQDFLAMQKKGSFEDALEQAYRKVESISIDYAISEHADNLVLIPGDFGWNDVGDWRVVYELGKKDDHGNVVLQNGAKGKLVSTDSTNTLVQLGDRLVAVVGLKDVVIVDTDEIVLVMDKSKSQDVKKIVQDLKEKKHEQYL